MLIKNIQAINLQGLSRMEVDINGETLWFESRDVQLTLNAEALTSALLFFSLISHRRLEFELPLNHKFKKGVDKLLATFHDWWHYPVLLPTGKVNDFSEVKPATGVGQCFTCGVDSFHSLIHNIQTVSHLIYVHGYDISLRANERMEVIDKALQDIAEYYEKKLVIVRTNLREHSVSRFVNWEHAHGGALAAVGHFLNGEIGKLIIPATFRLDENKPWGSTDKTDPLWSSDLMRVVHYGANQNRQEKVKSIVNESLVKKHLRVCWEMRNSEINCSECEKCIRTMLCISLWGQVYKFEQFDHTIPLENRIDSLPFITRHVYPYYRDFLESKLNSDLKGAIKRLIKRSKLVPATPGN